VKPRAAGVVLAAGLGKRFGDTPKLIATLSGKPLLQHVLDTLHEAEIAPIVVVLGHAINEVRAAIRWRDEIQVRNRYAERGILRSVLLGLRRLDEAWSLPDRTLIVVGDQPRLRNDQIESVLAAPIDEDRPFVVARYADGHSGNPVVLEASGRLVSQQLIAARRADTDRGLSQFFGSLGDRVRYVDVPGINPDVDTSEQLSALAAKAIVADAYDSLGPAFLAWSNRITDPARSRLIHEFMARLRVGGEVLDLGCGPGLPSTKQLAANFKVTGVDFSAAQLELARKNVPDATLIQADMTAVDFPPATFDGVAAFYSINHIPRDEVARLFGRIARWLKPDGLFLAALPSSDTPAWVGEWLGQEMFFSGYDAATNRALLAEGGFEILIDEVVEITEPEGPVRFLWVLARVSPA
jgi:CTP:molybdopterin cytidylyltransferase MocA/SAM-dependent methyltransferase